MRKREEAGNGLFASYSIIPTNQLRRKFTGTEYFTRTGLPR